MAGPDRDLTYSVADVRARIDERRWKILDEIPGLLYVVCLFQHERFVKESQWHTRRQLQAGIEIRDRLGVIFHRQVHARTIDQRLTVVRIVVYELVGGFQRLILLIVLEKQIN